MTSAINSSNIDGTYPIAGQDNNSQGFRDNFTNIATNLQTAASEISDLQGKVILSNALVGGPALTTQNNLQNSPLIGALISNFASKAVSLGVLTGVVAVDYKAGHYYSVSTGGSISLNFSNFPIAGQLGVVVVQVTVLNKAHTVTFPAAVSVNSVGTVGLSNNTLTFPTVGVYSFTFTTTDNGTTITLIENNKQLQPYDASSESLGTASTMSLGPTTSYFTTAGVCSLPQGVAGQIKVITQTYAGSMVVTVTSPGWNNNATGTITLPAIGTGCTLQYTYNKWYCIGNNGVSFG